MYKIRVSAQLMNRVAMSTPVSYTALASVQNNMIFVGDSHGIHGSRKELFRGHHVGKALWIQISTFGGNIIDIKVLGS
jgi:hypothetical protein